MAASADSGLLFDPNRSSHATHHIKRHPYGIIVSFGFGAVFIAGLSILYFVTLPNFVSSDSLFYSVFRLIFIIIILLTIAYMFMVDRIYWGNSLSLTADHIEYRSRSSFFNSDSQIIGLAEIENVTFDQQGFLGNSLHFGQLTIEFNSLRPSIKLHHCPRPDYFARQILARRQLQVEAEHATGIENAALNKNELPFGITYIKAIIARNKSMTIDELNLRF